MQKIIVDSYKISIADFYNQKKDNGVMKSDMKYPDFAKRLAAVWKACERAPVKQTPLAKWLGFSQPTVNDWLNGKGLPSMDTAIKLADKFECSVEWLMTGRGSKEVNKESTDPFYAMYLELPEMHRLTIKNLVQALSQTPAPQQNENKHLTEEIKDVGGGGKSEPVQLQQSQDQRVTQSEFYAMVGAVCDKTNWEI